MQATPQHVGISTSEVKLFMECRRAWAFSSPLRGNWQSKVPNKNLKAGEIAHAALAEFYTPRDDRIANKRALKLVDDYVDALLAQAREDQVPTDSLNEVLAEIQTVRQCLEYYFYWANKHDYFRVLHTEKELHVRLPYVIDDKQLWFVGRVDAVARHKRKNEYWLLEYKTCSDFPDLNSLYLDQQRQWYLWAALRDPAFEEMRPAGTIYTFIKKTPPVRLVPMKGGSISKAQRVIVRTTLEMYLEALEDYEQRKEDYWEAIEYLQSLEGMNGSNQFIQRVEIPLDKRLVNNAGHELLSVIGDMVDKNISLYKHASWQSCHFCRFSSPCLLVDVGSDPTPVLEQDFVHPAPRYIIEPCDE